MPEKTFISIEFWQIVSFLLGFLSVCYGFIKILMAQFQKATDERWRIQEKINAKIEDLERANHDLKATLPLNYVLREDYIRGQAVLEAKMDALNKTLSELYKMETLKKC